MGRGSLDELVKETLIQEIGDRYSLENSDLADSSLELGLIDEGGFSYIWLAYDKNLRAPVAIKTSKTKLDEKAIQIASKEVENWVELTVLGGHINIHPILDAGIADGVLYIVTPLVHKTLADRLEEGVLDEKEALQVLKQCASGLSYIHKKGLIHRDIKPDNIFYGEDGFMKISDFGISTVIELESPVAGTVAYIAPEVFKGVVDKRNRLTFSRDDLIHIFFNRAMSMTYDQSRNSLIAESTNFGLEQPSERDLDVEIFYRSLRLFHYAQNSLGPKDISYYLETATNATERITGKSIRPGSGLAGISYALKR